MTSAAVPPFIPAPGSLHRLFVAVELPAEVKAGLAKLTAHLKTAFGFTPCRLAWTNPDSVHLTLRFFGDVAAEEIPRMRLRLREIASEARPMTARTAGLGVFPHWGRPTVIWAGVEERSGGLDRLRIPSDELAVSLGRPPDPREFHPHLTLARVKSGAGKERMRGILESHGRYKPMEFAVESITLFRSEPRPEGALHEALARFPLGAPEDPAPAGRQTIRFPPVTPK